MSTEKAVEKESPWSRYIGQRMTFQTRSGVVIEGTITGVNGLLIELTEAKIIGRNVIVRPKTMVLSAPTVEHAHPPTEVEHRPKN